MLDNWYVLQVVTGKEEQTRKDILSLVDCTVIKECFIPKTKAMKKYQGQWHKDDKIMFPGYLFLITDHIEEVYVDLKKVPTLTKMLGQRGTEIFPLPEREVMILCKFANDDHIVDISLGFIEGDKITVTSGPLMGQEGLIKKIDRHKRIAEVEVTFFGQVIKAKVGLEIVSKK